MARATHHRVTPSEIVFSFWLVFSRDGSMKLVRETPSLSRDQRAMQIEARLPLALWNIPQLSAEIVVPDTGQPNAITARIEQFAADMKAAIGCDVVLTVQTPEGS